jgi:hypothetical protein
LLTVNEAALLVQTAVAAIAHLPPHGNRLDRRQLASDHAHNPHALDEGTTLAGLVLALTTAADATSSAQRTRDAWDSLGIDCDDLTGGLITVGIYPADWHLPPHAAITIPPRELISCKWPKASQPGDTVFVTENPSVASAAADLAREVTVRLVCTSGTPSEREVPAIAGLAEAGWHTRVRADFDPAGLAHATTLLSGIPGATPWRMGVTDYKASLPRTQRVSLDPARGSGNSLGTGTGRHDAVSRGGFGVQVPGGAPVVSWRFYHLSRSRMANQCWRLLDGCSFARIVHTGHLRSWLAGQGQAVALAGVAADMGGFGVPCRVISGRGTVVTQGRARTPWLRNCRYPAVRLGEADHPAASAAGGKVRAS